ncbi:P-loop containing nucleoside triphosphate hydrolase protein [Mycena floridula]|nr:P-loop containing nucleoside triphosphate hydrolase protein [Mycena floridula]
MQQDQVILVGIGGATCSGKTTLAKHLKNILPDSVIVHQDDFAPPQELVPIHPIHNVQDWDAPEGAISWPKMVSFLDQVKMTGEIPAQHRSHDHLNEQKDIPLSDHVRDHWKRVFQDKKKKREENGQGRIIWALVDGFLLYWHPEVREKLDVRFFLRVPEEILKKRRHERHGYHTAVQSDPEGSLWRDPPLYWEQIVWPAYVTANAGLFANEDITAQPTAEGIEVIEANETTMNELVERCCTLLDQ